MYQEVSKTACEKLAKLEDPNFRMLENTVIYDKTIRLLEKSMQVIINM